MLLYESIQEMLWCEKIKVSQQVLKEEGVGREVFPSCLQPCDSVLHSKDISHWEHWRESSATPMLGQEDGCHRQTFPVTYGSKALPFECVD